MIVLKHLLPLWHFASKFSSITICYMECRYGVQSEKKKKTSVKKWLKKYTRCDKMHNEGVNVICKIQFVPEVSGGNIDMCCKNKWLSLYTDGSQINIIVYDYTSAAPELTNTISLVHISSF